MDSVIISSFRAAANCPLQDNIAPPNAINKKCRITVLPRALDRNQLPTIGLRIENEPWGVVLLTRSASEE